MGKTNNNVQRFLNNINFWYGRYEVGKENTHTIAKKCGISNNTVARYFKKNGRKTRSNSGSHPRVRHLKFRKLTMP